MGRRNRYSNKELDELQKLKKENSKLKKQVSALRKQITRLDIDRYENLRELVHKYDKAEEEEAIAIQREKLKRKWQCFDCKTGVMYIHQLFRLDGHFYFRKCNNCGNKTKPKPYNEKVEGIKNAE